MMTRSDQDSIFGRTYQGVPNPQVPYEHPYPTRYHGPIWTEPRFGMPVQANPYALAPFSGESTDSDRAKGVIEMSAVGAVVAAGIALIAPKVTPKSPWISAAVIGGLIGAAVVVTKRKIDSDINRKVDSFVGKVFSGKVQAT